jgi:rhamnulokinase
MAEKVKPYRSIMIPQNHRYNIANLPAAIKNYCRNTGQPIPETEGELARCVYDSIALNSAIIINKMERLTSKNFKRIYVVSGGTRSPIMLQDIADITGKEVVSGSREAAVTGNVLVQLMALGELANLNEGRRLIKESFTTRSFFPSVSHQLDIDYYTHEMYDKTEVVT